MVVELEEVTLFSLFLATGKPFIIKESHLKTLPELRKDQRLEFMRHPDGKYFRQQGEVEFLLAPRKDGNWNFLINKDPVRVITGVHQIQCFWFALFDDQLFIPKDANMAPKRPISTGTFQRRH